MSKYRIGDKIHIETEITYISDLHNTLYFKRNPNGIPIDDIRIVKHIPREISVGDKVRYKADAPHIYEGIIIGISEYHAWVKFNNTETPCTYLIENLCHV